MNRIEFNLTTGEQTIIELTEEEAAELDAQNKASLTKEKATQYQRDRAREYPSFADQFDLLYHGGYDAWKAVIDAVKAKYPKGTV